MQVAHDLQRVQVDLHQLCGELAAGDEVAAIGTEVHVVDAGARDVEPVAEGKCVRVTEVEMALRLGHDDCPPAVGHEVHVVRVGDGDVGTGTTPGAGIDRRKAVRDVIGGVEPLHVPRRHDVLRVVAGAEVVDDLHRRRVDDVHRRAAAVGHVDAIGVALDRSTEHPGAGVGVDVRAAGDRGHSGQRIGGRRMTGRVQLR